jgi:tetratricopeptide (TPR) repeat protein
VSRDGANALAYRNLGALYDSTGNTDAAIASYNQAIAKGDKDEGTFFNRGLAYLGKGDRFRAAKDFEYVSTNATDDRLRNAAQSRLKKLDPGIPPKAQGEGINVCLQYQDQKDDTVMTSLVEALRKRGFKVGRQELVSPREAATTGDVRFFEQNKAQAAEVRKIVEDGLALEGFPLQLDSLPPDTRRFKGSHFCGVEVWLPPLSKSGRYVSSAK